MKLVELYRFVEGSEVFTQTSAAYNIDYNSETYEKQPLSRSEAESKSQLTRASISLTTDLTNPVAARYLKSPVDFVVTLSIFQQDDDGTRIFWKGRLTQVSASNKKVVLTFESFFTSMRRPGLRARYQKACRHPLYGRGCRLDPENFKISATVLSITRMIVVVNSVSGLPDQRLRGGMIRGPDTVLRFINSQVGTVVTLSRPYDSLIAHLAGSGYGSSYGGGFGATVVQLYYGCAHNPDDCNNVFNNLDNYGGFPWIPQINPFGGQAVGV
jgi:hypothetical protein